MRMTPADWEELERHVRWILDAPKDTHPSIAREVGWDLWRERFGGHDLSDAFDHAELALAGRDLAEAVRSWLHPDSDNIMAEGRMMDALAAWDALAPPPTTPGETGERG